MANEKYRRGSEYNHINKHAKTERLTKKRRKMRKASRKINRG